MTSKVTSIKAFLMTACAPLPFGLMSLLHADSPESDLRQDAA